MSSNSKLITINISLKDDYHTQINNNRIPFESCNTTSAIMALKNTHIKYDKIPDGVQDEDYLTLLLNTQEAWARMKQMFPIKTCAWAYDKNGLPRYKPQELFACLEWGINKKLVGKDVCKFNEHSSLQEILFYLLKGASSLVSGKFTPSGHIVCVSGFDTWQENIYECNKPEDIDLSKVIHAIVDDPYGNYHTNYEDHRGNDIYFDIEELNDIINTRGNKNNKWALLFDYKMREY